MLILGFNGGYDQITEDLYLPIKDNFHDSAAVLVEDGNVLFAIEEERLNRIKHTNKFPALAIQACLKYRNIQLKDLDLIVYDGITTDIWLIRWMLDNPGVSIPTNQFEFFQNLFMCSFGVKVDQKKFDFVHHHYAHAMSAYAFSGFTDSLCITFDGMGDDIAGIVLDITGSKIKQLASISSLDSLGYFYCRLINFLGFNHFDEYKVMGLAPYGNPGKYRSLFRSIYTLLPKGEYQIDEEEKILQKFKYIIPRRKGEPLTQTHKDFAATLQESLEMMAFHQIRHYKKITRHKNLCLAGGVAHNCTLNGKILRLGLFDNVFVQPAAHDAGSSLGAAMFGYMKANLKNRQPKLEHVFWGTDIGENNIIQKQLIKWRQFIDFTQEEKIVDVTAKLLSEDKVIGWVQGRSEFGPRALGNRSILADPRPANNKGRINKLIKKREGFRPFAPSVIEEKAEEYFDVDIKKEEMGFMIFVVDVKKDKQKLLGAVTHVDGTARIQTVSRKTNRRYWELIRTFGELTGVPVLLNTSFNNNAEPIVDSIEDAITCYLTTGIDYLVIGDYLIKRKKAAWSDYLTLAVYLPRHIFLTHKQNTQDNYNLKDTYYLSPSYENRVHHQISPELALILNFANSKLSINKILHKIGIVTQPEAKVVIQDLTDLWSRRLIILKPV